MNHILSRSLLSTVFIFAACSSENTSGLDNGEGPGDGDSGTVFSHTDAGAHPGTDGSTTVVGDGGTVVIGPDGSVIKTDGGGTPPGSDASVPPGTDAGVVPGGDAIIIGAGDIAGGGGGTVATANLIKNMQGVVFTLGDNAYDSGTQNEFMTKFNPTWGAFKARITLPVPGNHDYNTANATGYYDYFGTAAGDRAKGYYSTDIGKWHVIVINSNCSAVGGCNAGSPQHNWLKADLAAHNNACTIAMWHHPLFNIGKHGPETAMKPIFQALYDGGADVVLNGHDHDYQRWAPIDANGTADAAKGIREFVIGTGGIGFYDFPSANVLVEKKDNQTYGIIKLTLKPTSYAWEFIPEAGKTFTDSGTGNCH